MNGTSYLVLAAVFLGGYLLGNVNFALILSKLAKKRDVRGLGSGNPGTMNMLRTYGVKLGALTLVLDVAKGVAPALTGLLLFRGEALSGGLEIAAYIAAYTGGLGVVTGHIYPVFLKFKGGKGIATTLGVFLVTNWWLTLGAFILSVGYILLFEYGSVGNLIMITVMCCVEGLRFNNRFASYAGGFNTYLFVLALLLLVICFMTWFAHRGNLYRLLMGKEHKTRLSQMLKPKRRRKKPKPAPEDGEAPLVGNGDGNFNFDEVAKDVHDVSGDEM
jgi:glycerol-3-phosphate acyltransferase PlsY